MGIILTVTFFVSNGWDVCNLCNGVKCPEYAKGMTHSFMRCHSLNSFPSFTVWHSLVFSERPSFQLLKQLSTKSPQKQNIVKMAV